MSQIKAPILYDQSESKIIVCLPLFFRNILFHANLTFIQADFASSRTDIAVIGIRHFTGAIHNASHIPIFNPFKCEVAALMRAIVFSKS